MRTQISASIAIALLIASPPVFSQAERSGNADARVMQQLQQVTAERAALQAENAKLKEETEKLRKEVQQVSAAKTSLETRNKALTVNATRGEASGKQAEEQLEKTRGQLQELVAKFRETAQTLDDVETDRATVKGQLAVHEREFRTCVDRNAGLYNLNAEVLDRMENRGFWSNLAQREPFTKLKRVELENLIDDYKYRADELRLEQQKQASSATQAK
jgi:chromosome segregation ATPase